MIRDGRAADARNPRTHSQNRNRTAEPIGNAQWILIGARVKMSLLARFVSISKRRLRVFQIDDSRDKSSTQRQLEFFLADLNGDGEM